jgi:hypothetical protein
MLERMVLVSVLVGTLAVLALPSASAGGACETVTVNGQGETVGVMYLDGDPNGGVGCFYCPQSYTIVAYWTSVAGGYCVGYA